MANPSSTLDSQLEEFKSRSFITMPIAGAIVWLGIGVCGFIFESTFIRCMSIFAGTGMIFYVAVLLSKFTGEDLLGKTRSNTLFDRIFLLSVFQAVAVYSIAIPFFMENRESLPLTVGILTGLMWLPFSGMLQHWVGIFHAVSRTATCLVIWYAFPDFRFTGLPLAIVVIYLATIMILHRRVAQLPITDKAKTGLVRATSTAQT